MAFTKHCPALSVCFHEYMLLGDSIVIDPRKKFDSKVLIQYASYLQLRNILMLPWLDRIMRSGGVILLTARFPSLFVILL